MINNLAKVPFWAWVTIPAILLGLVVYLVNKNRNNAIMIALVAMVLAWLTAGLQFWQFYLQNHFVGKFDQFGLPGHYTRTGWALMIDAWPLWLVPAAVIVVIASGATLIGNHFYEKSKKIPTKNASDDTTSSTYHLTNAEVLNQLEIQKLKQQLEIAKDKYQKLQHDTHHDHYKSHTVAAPILQDVSKTQKLTHENKQLHDQNVLLKEELDRCKALIERLLEERLTPKA